MKNSLLTCAALLLSGFIAAQDMSRKPHQWEDAATRTLTGTEKQEAAVILRDKRVIEYERDEKGYLNCYYTRHKRVHINEEKSIEEYNRVYLPVTRMEEIIELKARTITSNGVIKELDKSDAKEITEDDQKYLILAIEGLEKGAELEYFYTFRKNISYFGTEYVQSAVLAKNVEVQIITPEKLKFEAVSYNGFPAFTDTVIDKKRYLQSSAVSVPAKSQDEEYAFYDPNLMRVEYKLSYNEEHSSSRLFTWNEAGKKYYGMMHQFEKGSEKDLKSLSSKLKLSGLSEEEKIRTIENFIKSTISFREDAPDEDIAAVLKKKYASKFGLLGLYALLFEYNQVAYETVCTSSRFERAFDPDFDSWTYLSEELFYFPQSKKYVIPASLAYRYGQVPYQFAPGNGLFIKGITIGGIKSGVSTIRKIDASPIELNSDNMKALVSFPAGMNAAKIDLQKTASGYPAVNLRPYYFYGSEEERKTLAESILKLGIDDATVQLKDVSNFNMNNEEVDKVFVVEGEVTISSLLEKANDTYLFKVGEVIGRQVEMYQEKPRESPAEIGFPHSYDREIIIDIPEGYAVKGLEGLQMQITHEENGDKIMGFISDYQLKDNRLTIHVNEYYKEVTYPLNIFEKYRKVINAAADFNKVTILFVKAS